MSRVIVLGPLPDSAGGIGVLMGHLSRTHSDQTTLEFVDSGGTPGITVQRLKAHLNALRVCQGPVPEATVFHINVSSGRSAWRKVRLARTLVRRGRPYVVHLHAGSFASFLKGLSEHKRHKVIRMFHQAAAVLVLGNYWRDVVVEETATPVERIHVIPNAVPGPQVIPERQDGPVVLFSGQLCERKGVLELLEAWQQLPSHLRSHLVLAGDLKDPDGRITAALKRTSDIEVTGWLGPKEINQRLAQASILVLPSYSENLPMSLLDGMAWELAPVVTPVGAVTEVVTHGESAWIVPPRDPVALRNAIESLMLDCGKCLDIAKAARQRWESDYEIHDYRKKLDALYAQVAAQ